jgi:bifunctional DNA-binding transcriptional regulator/antitoxin component of YhaV-PrlF toxin-antitoxin module
MKTGTFIAEVDDDGKIAIPLEIIERLHIAEGDKIEILLKKIRSKRFSLTIQKNPLYKLLELVDLKDQDA